MEYYLKVELFYTNSANMKEGDNQITSLNELNDAI